MSDTRWLNQKERELWLKLTALSMLMPGAVEAQLKREAGLNQFEYHVLAMLSEAPGRSLLMSNLAFRTNSSLSRLSHVVSRLEKQGWVTRSVCPTDGRATNAFLTDSGFEKIRVTAPGHVEQVRRIVFDPLTSKQAEQLSGLLDPLLESIDPEGRSEYHRGKNSDAQDK
ncbi:MarR family transcriptional regulator [Lysinibacter sp. HNR]|uniref:MarR family winged helix-turn-helix transcriptional regulator n=1 Tax=Lysinibacter sp. HNR TaxID=3031408 RepID=UPI0024350BE7|nr:MarR family transcriptional regulator [Lysinibacter sp. HNR]WGD36659.1 MarR family transcriptional regulator [Lysinibacter sp. HNR]